MKMENYPRTYLTLAFVAGVLLTLGFKDFYPDLERRFRQRRQTLAANWSRTSISFPWRPAVVLEDHTADDDVAPDADEPGVETHDWAPGGLSKDADDDAADADADADMELTSLPPIGEGVESTIGNTPLFRIKSLSEATGCEILAKAEYLNGAGGSPKDRVALGMIETAERDGLLAPRSGDVIYEGTVGSTGISLAAICRAKGYAAHICMPSDQSLEKSALLAALGAQVERVPPAPIVDPAHFVRRAQLLAERHTASPDAPGRGYFADQFENQANWRAHYGTTGPEIYAQVVRNGKRPLDAFVAGAGTGGTLSGVALFLKGKERQRGRGMGKGGQSVRIVLADPQGSGLYNKVRYGVMYSDTQQEGTRRRQQVDSIVEGIGITRVTENVEVGRYLFDDAVRASDDQALLMARWLVEKDGVFVGGSSAVNCIAATKTAREMGPGHTIVTILCDSGARHLSRFWKAASELGDKSDMTLDDILAS